MAASNPQMEKELKLILKRMKEVPKAIRAKERRKVLVKAARPLIDSAKSKITDSTRKHYRYRKNGDRIQYEPGNLRKSIRVLSLRKSPDVWVGPKVSRGNGPFGVGRKVDGYYAHFVHDGTPYQSGNKFLLRAAEDSGPKVIAAAKKGLADLLNKQIKKVSTK